MTAEQTTGRLKVKRLSDSPWRDTNNMKQRTLFHMREGAFEGAIRFSVYHILPPGAANATHVHADEEKIYFVAAGEGTVYCGDEEAHVTQGDAFFLPARVPHSLLNTGTEDFHTVVFCAAVPS